MMNRNSLEAQRKLQKPNTFSTPLLEKLLREHFLASDALTKVEELDSYDDRNYLCYASGVEYVLKVHNGADGADFPLAQIHTLQLLSQNGIRCPVDLPGYHFADGHFIRLLHFLPGRLWCDFIQSSPPSETTTIFHNLGTFLAKMDAVLAKHTRELIERFPILSNRVLVWDLQHFALIREFLPSVSHLWTEEQVHFMHATLEEYADIDSCQMNCSVIHNDANDHNLVVNQPNNELGILDFGDMVYTWRINELAIALAYVIVGVFHDIDIEFNHKNNVWLARAHALVLGYLEVYSAFSPYELDQVFVLIKTRLMTSACLGAYSASLQPSNAAYLLIHSQPAWLAMKALCQVGKKSFVLNIFCA